MLPACLARLLVLLGLMLLHLAPELVSSASVVRHSISAVGISGLPGLPWRLPWTAMSRAQRMPGASCTPGTKLSHPAALAMCQAAGIGIRSATGKIGCRDPGCVSLEQVRCETVLGILAFQRASGCAGIVITGGTEMGHDPGQYSHYNGYKLDIALTECASDYALESFRTGGVRPDGAKFYIDGRGNEYAMEPDHWDILYY